MNFVVKFKIDDIGTGGGHAGYGGSLIDQSGGSPYQSTTNPQQAGSGGGTGSTGEGGRGGGLLQMELSGTLSLEGK